MAFIGYYRLTPSWHGVHQVCGKSDPFPSAQLAKAAAKKSGISWQQNAYVPR